MADPISGIYKIKSKKYPGRCYIGSAVNIYISGGYIIYRTYEKISIIHGSFRGISINMGKKIFSFLYSWDVRRKIY
jgi:hypothetical protein